MVFTVTMSYTPWSWVHLLEFDLMGSHRCTCAIEYQEARTCCSLVYGSYEDLFELGFILSWNVVSRVVLRMR